MRSGAGFSDVADILAVPFLDSEEFVARMKAARTFRAYMRRIAKIQSFGPSCSDVHSNDPLYSASNW